MLLRTSIHSRHTGASNRLTPTDSSCLFYEALAEDQQVLHGPFFSEVSDYNS
jgi:hypothetical protein